MKKYLLSTLAVAGLFGITTTANAADDTMGMSMMDGYAVMQAGYGFGYQDNKEAGVFAVGGGFHLNEYLQSDLTVGFRGWGKVKEHGKTADIWSIPAFMNLYASIPYKAMRVYGMGGVGMSYNKVDNTSLTKGDDKMEFAWTAGGGVGYRLTPCWDLDLGYRYVDLGEGRSKFKDGSGRIKKDIKSHDVLLSARYYF